MKISQSILENLNENANYSMLLEHKYEDIKDVLPPETSKRNFEIFNTDLSYPSVYGYYKDLLKPDADIEREGYTKVYIAEMSPEDYINLSFNYCSEDGTPSSNIEEYLKDENESKKLNDARKYMSKPNANVNMPFLDFERELQDGNHRAAIAYEMGIKTIPVLILA